MKFQYESPKVTVSDIFPEEDILVTSPNPDTGDGGNDDVKEDIQWPK